MAWPSINSVSPEIMASSLPGLIDDSTVNEHSSSSRSWPSSGSLGSYRKSPCHKVPPARGFRRDRTLRFDRRDFDGARLERNLGWPRGGAAAVALRHARRGWPNGECPVRVTGPASPVIALAHRRRAERNQPPRLCWWWTRSQQSRSAGRAGIDPQRTRAGYVQPPCRGASSTH